MGTFLYIEDTTRERLHVYSGFQSLANERNKTIPALKAHFCTVKLHGFGKFEPWIFRSRGPYIIPNLYDIVCVNLHESKVFLHVLIIQSPGVIPLDMLDDALWTDLSLGDGGGSMGTSLRHSGCAWYFTSTCGEIADNVAVRKIFLDIPVAFIVAHFVHGVIKIFRTLVN
ncbi:hypothetical protein M427DRAFT_131027 [Gonapodya prolifera JEL478]|uniref:Uncharacterized protein n=1 Tax=Gonapodya prolifera (strain JEL478) TaxID=1344416 RepID=A0A139AVU2_GONPJ|nr:hypothetical protein M427DRAFT_131027 [Gonapodya prolifera JEL478]|eukprot:KXS20829.1 hypothetical protein M427DRAFT_131027 [Gonapodya prolifera JEL478]